MNLLLLVGTAFIVTLQPEPGTGGGPVRVEIEAHDSNTAKRLARAKYEPSYRVINVARARVQKKDK